MRRRAAISAAISALVVALASTPTARAQLWQQPSSPTAQPMPGQFQQPQPAPANPWGGMQAGGLTPPAPLPGGVVPNGGQT
ncbi:MAG: hypothetical protein ABI193_07725, partial [Minicystis sp.]